MSAEPLYQCGKFIKLLFSKPSCLSLIFSHLKLLNSRFVTVPNASLTSCAELEWFAGDVFGAIFI